MTARRLAPSALLVHLDDRVVAVLDAIEQRRLEIADPRWLTVLEAFVHTSSADTAAARASQSVAAASAGSVDPPDDDPRLERARQQAVDGAVLVSSRGIRVLRPGLPSTHGMITVTRASERRGVLLPFLCGVPVPRSLTPSAAEQTIDELLSAGLLVPAVGELDWGDLRRTTTLCPAFGLGRGTPIDRYYLHRFVEERAAGLTGDVLDVGGDSSDRIAFGLRHAGSFVVMDQEPGEGVDLAGDAHDASAAPDASFDTVLLFNVLEHCHDPYLVAANVHRWLRPGGTCLVMVPNAQRLHGAPDDLWRFSEAGLARVFSRYASVETRSYGNLTTVLASHLGIAAEELTDHELDLVQADHPVATCAVAVA